MPDDRGSLWIWFQASQWPKHRGKYFRLQAAVQRKNSFLKCCGLTDASPIAPHKERSVGCRVMLTSNLKIDPMAHLLGMLVKISLDASQWLQAQTHFTNGVGGRRNVFRSTHMSLVLPWGDPALPGKWGLWGTPLLSDDGISLFIPEHLIWDLAGQFSQPVAPFPSHPLLPLRLFFPGLLELDHVRP